MFSRKRVDADLVRAECPASYVRLSLMHKSNNVPGGGNFGLTQHRSTESRNCDLKASSAL